MSITTDERGMAIREFAQYAGTAVPYQTPPTKPIAVIEITLAWRCPYCQQNNPPERLDCRCCGAPKGK